MLNNHVTLSRFILQSLDHSPQSLIRFLQSPVRFLQSSKNTMLIQIIAPIGEMSPIH